MSISVKCSECGKSYKVPDEAAGKRIKCKECGGPIRVPRKVVESDDEFLDGRADVAELESGAAPPPRVPKGERRRRKRKSRKKIVESDQARPSEFYTAPSAASADSRTASGISSGEFTAGMIGLLNMVFGALLLLWGFCVTLNLITYQSKKNERVDNAVAHLERAGNVEKQRVQKMLGLRDAYMRYERTYFLIGVVLNVSMVVSGFGLLHLKGWARKTALCVAGIYIVVLFIMYALVVPMAWNRLAKVMPGSEFQLIKIMGEAAAAGRLRHDRRSARLRRTTVT